jgi:hypothetical protein
MANVLVTFLKEGRLGPLAPGMTREEVVSACGEPESRAPNHTPDIWTYGSLQLSFVEDRLYFVQIEFQGMLPKVPPAIVPEEDFFPGILVYEGFLRFLAENNVSWHVLQSLTFDRQVALETGASVTIVFGDYGLDTVYLCIEP